MPPAPPPKASGAGPAKEGREPVPRSVDEDTAIDEVVLQVGQRVKINDEEYEVVSTVANTSPPHANLQKIRTSASENMSWGEQQRQRQSEQKFVERHLKKGKVVVLDEPPPPRSPREHPWNRLEERLRFMEMRSMHSTASSSDPDEERLRFMERQREAPIMVEEAQQLPEQQYSSDPEEQPEEQQ